MTDKEARDQMSMEEAIDIDIRSVGLGTTFWSNSEPQFYVEFIDEFREGECKYRRLFSRFPIGKHSNRK